LVVHALAEDVVVEHRLLDRDRQRLLGAETNRVLELPRVLDAADLEHPDADAVVGDAEPHALARKLVLAEERLQLLGEQLRLADLAADDDAVAERLARDLDELGHAVVHDPRGRELRAADLEADQALRALAVAGALLAGARRLRLLLRLERMVLVEHALLPAA